MIKKNEIVKVRMGPYNRPCLVRIVDIVGDDAMVEQSNGKVTIVDVRALVPVAGVKGKNPRRKIKRKKSNG